MDEDYASVAKQRKRAILEGEMRGDRTLNISGFFSDDREENRRKPRFQQKKGSTSRYVMYRTARN